MITYGHHGLFAALMVALESGKPWEFPQESTLSEHLLNKSISCLSVAPPNKKGMWMLSVEEPRSVCPGLCVAALCIGKDV